MRLLIAEDDKALGMFLSRGLEADGHRVRLAYDGAAAVEAFRQDMPDLTILDLGMPIKDGEHVLAEVRALDADLPVLILTGRTEVETRVRCLDLGADDLMTKPFSLHELRARCRALLRRKRETRLQLRAGDLELDRLEHAVRRGGQAVVLTNKEFALLEHLLLNRGQCVTRVELLDSVWNLEPAQTTNIVDVYVNYLRRKLKDPPPGHLICTVRGRGYMVPSESELALDVAFSLAAGAQAARTAADPLADPLVNPPVNSAINPPINPPISPPIAPAADRGSTPAPGTMEIH
jgi:DNA-binding response OmpR family regulator